MEVLDYPPLKEIDIKKKAQVFDALYRMCLEHTKGHFTDKACAVDDCDCKHYIYEGAMTGCLGKDIFKQLRDYENYKFKDLNK